MPYKSDAQRRFFHSTGAKRAGISEDTVKEFDESSKGKDLPERADEDAKGRSQTHGRSTDKTKGHGGGKGGSHVGHKGK